MMWQSKSSALCARGGVALACVAALLSCSNPVDEARRGGGLEIPNGIQANVVVRLTDHEGAPLRNTAARVVAGESWGDSALLSRDPTLHIVTTDSQGLVSIPVDEARVFLWMQNDSQGIHMPLHPADSAGSSRSNPLPLQARALARILLIDTANNPVGLFGTPFAFSAAPPARTPVPAGEYMLVRKDAAGLRLGHTVAISEFDTLVDLRSMIFSDPNNLMLTNFQNRRVHNIWDPLHVGGYWWVDAFVGNSITWDHVGMRRIGDILDSSEGNIFAGIDVNFIDSDTGMAFIGLDFRTQPVNTNLSRASHISFKAKGSGVWIVSVETQNPHGGETRLWNQSIALTEAWQEFRLPLTSFQCEQCADAWNSDTRLGVNLYWQSHTSGTHIRLDDIIFEGLRFVDWVDP